MTPTHEQRMDYVSARMKAIGKGRVQKAQRVGREVAGDEISGALIIALALRESGGRNVLGDNGHARGAFQLTDTWNREFLRGVRGCVAAKLIPEATKLNWVPVPGTNALMRGMAPSWENGARRAVEIITGHLVSAKVHAVPRKSCLAVAVAAFNAGFVPALQAYRQSGDPDDATTGGDYSRDVLLRRSEVAQWLSMNPNWTA